MMKRALPYLLVTLIFAAVLNFSRTSYTFINTHDEDDNVVSGFLMSRNGLRMSKDIFSHHLPGAYLISEILDRTFHPTGTDQSVFVHRTFVTIWNYVWALILLSMWGPLSLWLIFLTELLRASYLHSLFQAENLVVYPMVLLLLTTITDREDWPFLSGFSTGLILIMLSPLWPFVLWTSGKFWWTNRRKPGKIMIWTVSALVPVAWTLAQTDIREFINQFFGYNALTYVPLIMGNPLKYTIKVFLAPVLVFRHFTWSSKIILIQLLSLMMLVIGLGKVRLRSLIIFGLWLGIIGCRSVPGLSNVLDFHVLPWVVTLGTLCWYGYFGTGRQMGYIKILVLLFPFVLFIGSMADFFPNRSQAGKMVVRYADNSPVVNYLNSVKSSGDTLFTLPAHTLLYQQTQIQPFNKFLFFLPWMQQSSILFTELVNSFRGKLPTYIFIDNIHFPYSPPEEVRKLLVNYEGIRITEGEPVVYRLRKWRD